MQFLNNSSNSGRDVVTIGVLHASASRRQEGLPSVPKRFLYGRTTTSARLT